MKASKKIEKVQLVLPPPRRPDTYTANFTEWPQPFERYARKLIFRLAEVAMSRSLFADILQRLIQLRQPRGQDTDIAKFAKWPQPLGILSVDTYIKQNNPGGLNILPLWKSGLLNLGQGTPMTRRFLKNFTKHRES